MNTPTHIIVNLAVLDKKGNPNRVFPIFLGSIFPDLPAFLLVMIEGFIKKTPQSIIWGEIYFSDNWQVIVSSFNSLPFIALLLIGTYFFLRGSLKHFFLLFIWSMLLHILLDFSFHHDDAYSYFFPFSNWKYLSPFSYWDVNHHAQGVVVFEVLLAVLCSIIVFLRKRSIIVGVTCFLLVVVYIVYGWAFYSGNFSF